MSVAIRRLGMGMASTLTVALVAWPAVAPRPADGMPVSNYAMFARPRGRVGSFPAAVLRDVTGAERRLGVREISGTSEPMQAAMTIGQAIRAGTADVLCAEIANVLADVGEVEILTVTYDAVSWFEGDRTPIARDVHATCVSEDWP